MDYDWNFEHRNKLLNCTLERIEHAQTLEEIIEVVRSSARHILSAEGVTFVLRENGMCHYVEENAIKPLWKGGRFPLETCISGWAMLNKQTVVIEDVFADSRIPHEIYRATFVKSLAMAPIGVQAAVAAIGVYWSDYHKASDDELQAIEAIADQIGRSLTGTMREGLSLAS